MTRFWDRITVGHVSEIGSHAFRAEDIKRFAEEFDPQIFHLDEEKAKASVLGGLCASGWHTAAVCMRLNVDFRRRAVEAFAAEGHPAPKQGPSPGVTNLRWPRPVYAGDTVTFIQEVTGKRVSSSRPGWGVVETSTRGVNQHGVTVFSFDAAAFIGTD